MVAVWFLHEQQQISIKTDLYSTSATNSMRIYVVGGALRRKTWRSKFAFASAFSNFIKQEFSATSVEMADPKPHVRHVYVFLIMSEIHKGSKQKMASMESSRDPSEHLTVGGVTTR